MRVHRSSPHERTALNLLEIRSLLEVERVGQALEHFEVTGSTNDDAWRHADNHQKDGLTVLAEYQTAGRGRLGRSWTVPPRTSILCSTLLCEPTKAWLGPKVVLASAIAIHDAIERVSGVDCVIKWPNDLLVRSRKVGGILVESRVVADGVSAMVLGYGVNCYQKRDELPQDEHSYATSLTLESALPISREQLAAQMFTELDRWLAHPQTVTDAHLRDAWRVRAEPVGTRIELQYRGRRFRGSMVDLDPAAMLVVRLDGGGVRAFNAAETTIARTGAAREDQSSD